MTKPQQRSVPELIKTAKALQAKAVQAADKAEQFYISLGLTLAELKTRKPKAVTWPEFVKKHFNFSRSRADELIQIADGRTTVDKVNSRAAESMRKTRRNVSADRPSGDTMMVPITRYPDRTLTIAAPYERLVDDAESAKSEPEMEQAYTALIKNRLLYEGACHLPWAKYFEYRDAHPECAPLTSSDLAYVGQWTSDAPAPAADTPTPTIAPDQIDSDDDNDESDDESDSESEWAGGSYDTPFYIAAVLDMLNLSENDPFWTALIADANIGGVAKLRELIAKLQAVCDAHCESSAVKAKADRAEAKVARMARAS